MNKRNFSAMFVGLSFIVCMSFCSTGCSNRNADLQPEASAVVLKFKNPDYKNYILANYFEGKDKILGTRYNMCGEPIGNTGYSPYWELPNDWLLVDWKWRNFPYNAGLTLLTELTWDKFEIDTTVSSGIPSWPLSEPHVLQPVDKILYIKALNLESYSKTTFPNKLMAALMGKDISDEYTNCEVPEKMDSLWTILQNALSIAIENGDLEHINEDK